MLGLEPVPGDSVDLWFSAEAADISTLPPELGLSTTAFSCVMP